MKKSNNIAVNLVVLLAGAAAGSGITFHKESKKLKYQKERVDKFYNYFHVVNHWLQLKNQGISLSEYFVKNDYKNIAIYGIGELGNRLYEELKSSEINVKYAIDKKTYGIESEIKVYEPQDDLEKVDVIVITPFFDYNSIEEMLLEKVECDIISIEDVVDFF